MQFYRAGQSQQAFLSEGHTQSFTAWSISRAERPFHYVRIFSTNCIISPVNTISTRRNCSVHERCCCQRSILAGRLATREVLIACNREASQSVKPCVHLPSSRTHSRLWFTRVHTTRQVLRTLWLFVWLGRLKKWTIENHMEIWQGNKWMPTTCGVRRSLMSITDPCLID